jgi:uncharacterized membrane-anchored protein
MGGGGLKFINRFEDDRGMSAALQSSVLPPDHPDRAILADEVHARPPEALSTPSRISYVAVLIDREQRERERAHLRELCESLGFAAPPPEANHFSVQLPAVRFKWERHGEFSGYTFVLGGSSPQPFSEPPVSRLPPGWLKDIPGRTLFAAHAKVILLDGAGPDSVALGVYFGDSVVVGGEIGGGAGFAYTDFKVRDDGFTRFLIVDRSFTPRQAGRMVQRLFEIEAYRMMSLLALPLVRPLSRQIAADEQALAELTSALAGAGTDDEALLQRLTGLSAEIQGAVTRTQFRFDACRAYHDLVQSRITELRERRVPGIQPIGEFMSRRFSPAVATCASTAQRLRDLADRVAQASALLSARVDIARERQNQRLLQSMNLRAERQFQLQQTIEGLSVAAIVYYVAGLVGYIAKALKSAGIHVDPELTVGTAIPVIAALCLWALHRTHRKLEQLSAPRPGP